MRLESALMFLNYFKVTVTKKTIMNSCIMNVFLALFTVFLIQNKAVIIITSAIILINLLSVLIFSTSKFWSFSNGFLSFSVSLIISVVLLNFIIYGFQTYLDSFSLILFIVLILVETVVMSLIAFYKYKSIINNKTRIYNAVPTYAGVGGLLGYILAKLILTGSSELLGSIIFTACVYFIILALIYIIVAQLLPRYYVTKKFAILSYID